MNFEIVKLKSPNLPARHQEQGAHVGEVGFPVDNVSHYVLTAVRTGSLNLGVLSYLPRHLNVIY